MTAYLHAFLDALVPAAPTRLGPVTLLPLRAPAQGPEVTLLQPDTTGIKERGPGGMVGVVDVHNPAALPLLLLAGEMLVGAKQNRIVNASTLVASGATQALHVSCVEQGRWAFGRERSGFRGGRTTSPWSMRSRSCRSASRSKRRRGESRADQGDVWEDVRTHLHQRDIHSDTMSLTASFERERVRISALLDGWTPGPEDVGAALFVGNRLIGVEAFGRPDTWAAASSRVLAGVVQERPIDDAPPADPVAAWDALRARVRTLELETADGDGLGEELHGESGPTHIVALMQGDAVVHMRVADVPDADLEGRGSRGRGSRGRGRRGAEGIDTRTLRQLERERRRQERGLDAAEERRREHERRREESRLAHRVALRDDARRMRARIKRRDEDILVIDRPVVVTTTRFFRRWRDRNMATHALPLPRRIAGGIAAWPLPDLDTAEDLLDIIERLGIPRGAFLLIDPTCPPPARDRRWLALHVPEPGVLHARCVG